MITYSVAYLCCAAAFVTLDFTWLSLTANRLYRAELGAQLADKVQLAPGGLFYLIYVAGVVGFCVAPALRSESWPRALGAGALLGLVAYSTYDLTNQATMRVWSTKVTLLDLGWGVFATGVAALAGYGGVRLAARLFELG